MNDEAVSEICVIGSINTDMVITANSLPTSGKTVLGGDFHMNSGGKGANQAVAVARHGAHVSMIASLGEDLFGDVAIARLQAESIDCSYVSRDSQQTSGVALICVDANGENQIVVAPGANSSLSTNHVSIALSALPSASLVLLQLEIPLTTVKHAIALAKEKKCRVILDPAPAQELPPEVLHELFIITPNESEAEILTGITISNTSTAKQAVDALLKTGVLNVALTLGSEGVLLGNAHSIELITAPRVSAVDSTAAGDCFNGALAVALSRGSSLVDAAAFACRAASISVTRRGAQDAMPRAHEVKM